MKNRITNSSSDSGNLSILMCEETHGAADIRKVAWRLSQVDRYFISDVGVSINYTAESSRNQEKALVVASYLRDEGIRLGDSDLHEIAAIIWFSILERHQRGLTPLMSHGCRINPGWPDVEHSAY